MQPEKQTLLDNILVNTQHFKKLLEAAFSTQSVSVLYKENY
jgi:hypothetical protein